MIHNAKSWPLVILSTLISNAALADSALYGSVSYGSQSASRDGFSYTAPLGAFVKSTPYGAGQSIDFMLGASFGDEKKIFLELSSNRLLLDETISVVAFPEPIVCIALAGVICPYSSEIRHRSHAQNTDLMLGWNVRSKNNWVFQPYLGVRHTSLKDMQRKEPRILVPFRDNLNELDFNSTGLIAGFRVQKNIGNWFYSGELNASTISGTSTLKNSIGHYDDLYRIPWRDDVYYRKQINVKQWQANIAFGRRLEISEKMYLNFSLGYRIGGINGFDTINENADSYQYPERDRTFDIKPKGFDLTMGWNF